MEKYFKMFMLCALVAITTTSKTGGILRPMLGYTPTKEDLETLIQAEMRETIINMERINALIAHAELNPMRREVLVDGPLRLRRLAAERAAGDAEAGLQDEYFDEEAARQQVDGLRAQLAELNDQLNDLIAEAARVEMGDLAADENPR